jgi:hexulose-6-phosphate isomerase
MDSPSDLDRDEVIRARDATGLPIHGVVDSVHWQKTLSDPDPAVRAEGLAGLKTALDDARAYGASTVLLVPAVVNKAVSYADAYERSQAEIRKVLPTAQEYGVKIAIENVWNHFLLSPLECARYIDAFESAWIGWYFDIGNVVNYGWPEHWIRTLGARILKLDVKEYSREKRNNEGPYAGFRVPLGDGDCDWPAVRQALADIGYEGWATAEIPGGDAERLRDIAERMDRILLINN